MTDFKFFQHNGRRLWILLPSITALILFVAYACRKDAPQTPQNQFVFKAPAPQASERDGFEVDLTWLQTFQTNLQAAVGGRPISEAYSFEQMVSGVEALINIATTPARSTTIHKTKVVKFFVSSSLTPDNILEEIYNNAYNAHKNHWLSRDTSETYPVVVDVAVSSVSPTDVEIKVTSIMGICNTCILQNYINSSAPCDGDAFAANEAYYVGGGDEEESLISAYIKPMCNHPCGATPACGTPESTAYEQIEARINANYFANNPPCGPGAVFKGWANVMGPIYAQGAQYDFLEEDCGILDQYVGECMDATDLNCAYCSFYEQIGTDPFTIPSGKKFISLNLGVNFCFCADHVCDYIAHPIAEYYVGTPICKLKPSWPGWDDPVSVSLADLYM